MQMLLLLVFRFALVGFSFVGLAIYLWCFFYFGVFRCFLPICGVFCSFLGVCLCFLVLLLICLLVLVFC